jgi:hypothetical protein
MTMNEHMNDAYRAAREILDAQTPAEDRDVLGQKPIGIDPDVIVVRGQYDHVQSVLGILRVQHRTVNPDEVACLALEPRHLLIINCPGQVPRPAITVIRGFVERGGTIFSTDWALRHVVEPAFPGTVAYNERPTHDEVVRVEIKDRSNPYVDGIFHAGADPVWWLEGSSYPIRVLDPERVRVLLTSRELGARYGEPAVTVQFAAGQGEVLHMISHYYLQRAETRSERHKASWKAYAVELGVAEVGSRMPNVDHLRVAEVEAAHTSLRFMSQVIVGKRKRNKGKT